MNYRLKRVDPIQLANILAVVYGVMMAVVAVLFGPLLFLAMMVAPEASGRAGMGVTLLMLVLYPILGIFIGWVSGAGGGLLFNLAAGWMGGLRLRLDAEPEAPAESRPAPPVPATP